MAAQEPIWSVYIIRTVDDYLYSGVTTDVPRRYREHRSGGVRAAKYLKAHKPSAIALATPIGTRALAQKVEYHLKRLTREQKETLIRRQALVFDPQSGAITL
jgi:putative endonuclease